MVLIQSYNKFTDALLVISYSYSYKLVSWPSYDSLAQLASAASASTAAGVAEWWWWWCCECGGAGAAIAGVATEY